MDLWNCLCKTINIPLRTRGCQQSESCQNIAEDAALDMQKPSSYDDLLPASYRTSNDDIEPPTLTIDFLKQELQVERLNDIHDWLWLAGRPMPARPLYYQKALRRDIVVHERMDLHLVWVDNRIFLKPIPRYLLDQQFWQEHLSCKVGCSFPTDGRHDSIQERAESTTCERCKIHQCALGFILSYAALISYESDLCIAKDANLVSSETTWPAWRSHVNQVLAEGKRRKINKRYIFGELRLARLNMIYKYTWRSPVRGYLSAYTSYDHFWHRNLVRIASLFAYLAVVLTAMQVGLATTRLQGSYAFQQASFGFTVFSILAPPAFVGLVSAFYLGALWYNLNATFAYWRKRSATVEQSRAVNIA
ncbi:MAG: hypothetical protein Q9171_004655 [Xanthocarpia ochracea]